jgi:membrane protease YdiL (CAAX protease family)
MKLLGFTGRIKGSQLGITILIVFFSMFVSASLAYFNEMIPLTDKLKTFFDNLEKDYNDQVEAIITLNNLTDYIIAVGIMALIPAICEETLFRGGLQNFLTRSTKMPWLSILVISLIFSVVHFSFYGFLSRFFLGIMLGLLYYYSGRLWLSILAHFINNLVAVTAIYILTLQGKSIKEAIEETGGTAWYIAALPVVVILFFWFYRVSQKNKEAVETTAPVQNNPGDLFC